MKDSIKAYLQTRSNEASNRRVINPAFDPDNDNDKCVSVRYLDDNMMALYNEWVTTKNLDEETKPSLSTFKKYLTKEGIYKKPYRWTDLCDYCESLRKLKTKLPNELAEFGYEWPSDLSYAEDNIREHFRNTEQAVQFLKNKKTEKNGVDTQKVRIKLGFIFYFPTQF